MDTPINNFLVWPHYSTHTGGRIDFFSVFPNRNIFVALVGVELSEKEPLGNSITYNEGTGLIVQQFLCLLEAALTSKPYHALRTGWSTIHLIVEDNGDGGIDPAEFGQKLSTLFSRVRLYRFRFRCVIYRCGPDLDLRENLARELSTYALNQRDFDKPAIPAWAPNVVLLSNEVEPQRHSQ